MQTYFKSGVGQRARKSISIKKRCNLTCLCVVIKGYKTLKGMLRAFLYYNSSNFEHLKTTRESRKLSHAYKSKNQFNPKTNGEEKRKAR